MKNNGFILITTLIFILFISLFACQALESMILEIKLHQIVKRQKFLFNEAQKNLESSEKDLKKHCSLHDPKNTNNCSVVQSVDDEKFRITSIVSGGDMAVILQSVCIKAEAKHGCAKRLSWKQLSL